MPWISGFAAVLISLAVPGESAGQIRSAEAEQETAAPRADDYPQRPIRVIVPFAAGGGSDTFVRILQHAIEEHSLLPQPVVVINVPGAGGAIGSRQVMESEPDGYTLMCLHESIISARTAGTTDYGPEAFEAIAGTGVVGTVIAVSQDAEYADLKQLLDDAAARPEQVVFSANIGAPSHFAGLMLEGTKPGARFRYTQTGGGAKRFAALAGGHIDVSSFSFAEYMQFRPAGLRALAFCGKSRHPAAPELPTAAEQGFDVISNITQFWWAPRHTSPERINAIADVLQQAMQTPQVQKRLEAIYTDRVFLTGDALQKSLAETERRYAGVAQRELTKLPDFPILVLSAVIVLAFVVAVQQRSLRRIPAEAIDTDGIRNDEYSQRPGLAVVIVGLTTAYVFVMQLDWIGFRAATAIYMTVTGLMLVRLDVKRLPGIGAIALITSFGLHFVFTNVFTIAIP